MRATLAISVFASAALLLTACGSESVEGSAKAGESTPISTPTDTTPDVCAGKSDCIELAVADVDGDGIDDAIGRVGDQIVVRTASGVDTQVAGTASKTLTDPVVQRAGGFVGAWDIDGRPGAEVVIATVDPGVSASYKVWSWEDSHLAVMSPPVLLLGGSPVEWTLYRGEGNETAVRCTGDTSRPIEVWEFTAPYGGSTAHPSMTVTSYNYDGANGGQFGDGSMFGQEETFNAEPQNLGHMAGWPWLCGDNAIDPATVATVKCGTTPQSAAIADAISQVPADSRIPGIEWTFLGDNNFDPCADLSYAMAEAKGGTGSSPEHVMFFHRGKYLGTATSCAFGFTSVVDSTSDSATVQYRWPRGMDSNAHPSGLASATFVWDGEHVVMQNDLPAELLKVSGCQ
ncbi:LppP/LprE family lipoprotein [Rhodococcus sp. IEGM 1379]|uniref:LppP/LprE family lipoprotein n=1 Tax=Rhodococcus sp. IEGM 1379 TaxID=3047086 RepID=UPI0024B76EFB|nr:LppP/LprE family lipoprotein [Rhodococcus sp. IEGM 1379]MDI9916725.1 LppP/LprE family lipoprotein [Rhodococcus sp. IEGM 1379]